MDLKLLPSIVSSQVAMYIGVDLSNKSAGSGVASTFRTSGESSGGGRPFMDPNDVFRATPSVQEGFRADGVRVTW